MSRTYRQKSNNPRFNWLDESWISFHIDKVDGGYRFHNIYSKVYRKESARLHRDGFLHSYHGPRQFRKLNAERPQRRQAKLQLFKFRRNPEYEVCLVSKVHLPYWY